MLHRLKIVAHRGYSEKYPENTMLAFEKAMELGSDSIELDVHLTKDKKLVIHHDYYLGKTDNGKGVIYNSTADYLRSLDAGKWKSKEFTGEKILFLREVFEKFGDEIEYEIELKGTGEIFINKVISEVKNFNLLKNIEFTSWHIPSLIYLKNKVPTVKIGYLVSQVQPWMKPDLARKIILENALVGNFDVVHFPLFLLNKKFVNEVKKTKTIVHAANCNTAEEIIKALSLNVDKFSTDKLDLAISLRGRK